jgi:membrane protease YdiL (CAAX protease family)
MSVRNGRAFELRVAAQSNAQPGRELGVSTKVGALPSILAMHLLPGALGVAAYAALSGPVRTAGYPPLAALLAAAGLVILPVELLILWLAQGRARRTGETLIPYRAPLSLRSWAWLVPALLIAAILASLILAPIDSVMGRTISTLFPAWDQIGHGLEPLAGKPLASTIVSGYSSSVWLVTLGAYLLVNGVAEPIVEELYFRGWLLPRLDRLGRWAPLMNVAMFSLYHFWLPVQLLSRLAAVTPFAYAVRQRRNVYLGMVVHISLNLVAGVIVIASIAGQR